MINWFGPESWGAPICRATPRCDIPVGNRCGRCREPFTDRSNGVTIPGGGGPVAFHLSCHLKMVVPHKLWPSYGLIPNTHDGLKDGEFYCPGCKMHYSVFNGWSHV